MRHSKETITLRFHPPSPWFSLLFPLAKIATLACSPLCALSLFPLLHHPAQLPPPTPLFFRSAGRARVGSVLSVSEPPRPGPWPAVACSYRHPCPTARTTAARVTSPTQSSCKAAPSQADQLPSADCPVEGVHASTALVLPRATFESGRAAPRTTSPRSREASLRHGLGNRDGLAGGHHRMLRGRNEPLT